VPALRLAHGDADQRRAVIFERLREWGHVSVSALSSDLGVTEMTIRRDLKRLTADGLATLVHGGARLARRVPTEFGVRAVRQAAEKRRIGQDLAARLDGVDVIGIDAGTTALEVALHLPGDHAGTVVTHSVPVLSAMLQRPNAHTIGVGGDLLVENQVMVSSASLRLLENMRLNMFVLGANGIDALGVYVHTAFELDVKRAYINAADKVVLVMDSSKTLAEAPVRICGLERITEIVTDAPLPADVQAAFDAVGGRTVLAG
jgi:DeoR/GlpR family transcriptional regulator of sugar metabolism